MQRKYDAIVVLGGGLRKDGSKFYPATYEDADDFGMLGGNARVLAAAALYRSHAADVCMFTTGVYAKNKSRLGDDVPAESEIYARHFKRSISLFSPQEPRIILDTISTTTLTNMQEVFATTLREHWHTIALISNEYHIPRIRALCEHVLRHNPSLSVSLEFLSAEQLLKTLQPGEYDGEIERAYSSAEAKKRMQNEARGLRDLREGRYALNEFQLDKS